MTAAAEEALRSDELHFLFSCWIGLGTCWISFLGHGGSTLIKADLHPLTKVPPGGRGDIPSRQNMELRPQKLADIAQTL